MQSCTSEGIRGGATSDIAVSFRGHARRCDLHRPVAKAYETQHLHFRDIQSQVRHFLGNRQRS